MKYDQQAYLYALIAQNHMSRSTEALCKFNLIEWWRHGMKAREFYRKFDDRLESIK